MKQRISYQIQIQLKKPRRRPPDSLNKPNPMTSFNYTNFQVLLLIFSLSLFFQFF